MKKIPLNKKVFEARLSEIRFDLKKLQTFQNFSLDQFLEAENFAIAEHYLRRALEAIFDIGNHILSRLSIPPGERPSTYKEIAQLLGRYKVIPRNFAEDALAKMAGYRTRLVHFYHKVTKEELYQIIQTNLVDVEKFCHFIKQIIDDPQKLNLKIK